MLWMAANCLIGDELMSFALLVMDAIRSGPRWFAQPYRNELKYHSISLLRLSQRIALRGHQCRQLIFSDIVYRFLL